MSSGAQIVLVEGPPGAGKSTTGERLTERLAARGVPARYLFGFAPAHPIRTRVEARARQHMAQALNRVAGPDPADEQTYTAPQWSRLVTELAESEEVLVVEGKLFQQCLEYLFLSGATVETVLAEQARILAALEPVQAVTLYLGVTNLRAHLERTIAERGSPWASWLGGFFALHPWGHGRGLSGASALQAFYEDWSPVEARLVASQGDRTLRLYDASDDWAAAHRAIDRFLEQRTPVR